MAETATTSSTELPGFEEVNLENLSEETLTVEDLKSNKKQLWLIKVPYEFDISKLSDTTVILNGTQDLPIKITDKGLSKRYETRGAKYDQRCPFAVVVPSSNNDLQVAKGFAGHLDITQTVQVPMLVYPPAPPPMYTDVPKGLKRRWKPFGHETPPSIHENSREDKNTTKKTQHKIPEKRTEHKLPEKRTYKENNVEIKKEKISPKKKKIKKEPEEEREISSKPKQKKKKRST